MSQKHSEQRPIIHHHIVLKPHHKKLIIGGTSLVVIFMIVMSVFVYMIYTKMQLNYTLLDKKIDTRISDVKSEISSNVNTLSESILGTRQDVTKLDSQLGVIHNEFTTLKASVGEDFSGIVQNSVPSVVTIRTDVAQGTGFIVNENGYIVTNAHVLSGGTVIMAVNYKQQMINATLIGYDANLDIALLKIPGTYTSLSLADSDKVQVGEKVIAIGNPLGLQFSVSEGIVSAVHRQGPNGINSYIQTDAALNPGNSGGPLINNNGEVIGINNFKAGDSESLGFALESNYIKSTVNAIFQKSFRRNLI